MIRRFEILQNALEALGELLRPSRLCTLYCRAMSWWRPTALAMEEAISLSQLSSPNAVPEKIIQV